MNPKERANVQNMARVIFFQKKMYAKLKTELEEKQNVIHEYAAVVVDMNATIDALRGKDNEC